MIVLYCQTNTHRELTTLRIVRPIHTKRSPPSTGQTNTHKALTALHGLDQHTQSAHRPPWVIPVHTKRSPPFMGYTSTHKALTAIYDRVRPILTKRSPPSLNQTNAHKALSSLHGLDQYTQSAHSPLRVRPKQAIEQQFNALLILWPVSV